MPGVKLQDGVGIIAGLLLGIVLLLGVVVSLGILYLWNLTM